MLKRLRWPKDAKAKHMAVEAVAHLHNTAEFRIFLELVLHPSLDSVKDDLLVSDPGHPEFPRLQGAGQVMQDLSTISQDARDILERR